VIMACRKGGRVSIPGVYGGFADKFPIGALMEKGLTIRTGQTHVQSSYRWSAVLMGDDLKARFVTIAAWALLALSGCAKEDANSNAASARDAAPGRLSETSPPSTPANDSTPDDASGDSEDHPPRQ
jgi:hypothetical protein